MKQVSLREIVEILGEEVLGVRGPLDLQVERPVPIDAATAPHTVTFCNLPGDAGIEAVRSSGSTAVVCTRSIAETLSQEAATGKTLIAVDNPRLTFIRLLDAFFAPPRPVGVHPTATIEEFVKLGERIYVGPYAYVAGDSIGDDTVIHGHVHIYHGTRIGRNVTVHAGAVIGADGLGFERDSRGSWRKFPHLGSVIIEDDVEIGANACIDRGALGSTVIRRGAKIDNLVYIAHNVTVGEDTIIVAQAAVAGSVEIGPRSWIAPSAVIRDKVKVGKEAVIGLGAVVTKDVPDGVTVMGVPARSCTENGN